MRRIDVRTSPNGYELSFDGMKSRSGYFFFTAKRLVNAMGKMLCEKTDGRENISRRAIKDHEELKKTRRAYRDICKLYVMEREQRIAMSTKLLELVEKYPLDDETIKTLREWNFIPKLTLEELKLK